MCSHYHVVFLSLPALATDLYFYAFALIAWYFWGLGTQKWLNWVIWLWVSHEDTVRLQLGCSYLKVGLRLEDVLLKCLTSHGWHISADCWQNASVPQHMDLLTELMKCLPNRHGGWLFPDLPCLLTSNFVQCSSVPTLQTWIPRLTRAYGGPMTPF